MGSSRASTPAGRRRTAQRAARARGGASGHAPATPGPKAKGAPARSKPKAKGAPARSAPKTRKPAPKRKAPAAAAARKAARPRKTEKPRKAGKARTSQAAGHGRARFLSPGKLVAVVAVVLMLAAAYQFWFRDSSLVAVADVTVTGISGPEARAVTETLTEAAAGMTTLNVDQAALDAAASSYPTVVDVSADADFPHALALTVRERPPVLVVTNGEDTQPVAGDGTVLRGVDLGELKLPSIDVTKLPARGKLDGDGLQMALVLGGAPEPLRELVRTVSLDGSEGVEVVLKGDIPIYFGGGERVEEKWSAAAAVLADPSIDKLTYVDVRVPARPAVGGAAPAVSETTTETGEGTP